MKTGTVYKVVYKTHDNRLLSAFVRSGETPFYLTIEYREGKEASANIGKVFAFNDLENAVNFYRCHGNEIWECRAKNIKKLKQTYCIMGTLDDIMMHAAAYWSQEIVPSVVLAVTGAPEGTVVCEALTLERKVTLEETNKYVFTSSSHRSK